jgi:cytochrome P450
LETLQGYLDSCAKDNTACEMRDLMLWFSFDVMGELVFSTSFGMVRKREWHPIVRHVKEALHLVGLLSAVPWLMQIGFRLAPPVSIMRNWHKLVDYCKYTIRKRIERDTKGQAGHDFMHYMLQQQDKFGHNGGPDWLTGDTLMMLVAGRQVNAPIPRSCTILLFDAAASMAY